MIKIPVITQNFSSPDGFSDTPLMLLPQPNTPPLPDRDQEGFSQLLLHDLHRHRNTFVRSYTAFETLKKRQDFVLRQENLRALQFYEQRLAAKQDQFIDQSIHAYEQCFVKVINGNLNTNSHSIEQLKRRKTMSPSFDRFHPHQLSHSQATPRDHPSITQFDRYQRTHRPPKYRSQASLYRSAQSLQDAFDSASFAQHSQPFISFTENYLQKFGDQSTNKFHRNRNKNNDDDDDDDYSEENGDNIQNEQRQIRSASAQPSFHLNQAKKQDYKSKTSDLQYVRTAVSSRNTNTPSSTPRMTYSDAVRDGLIVNKENESRTNRLPSAKEKRSSSRPSSGQLSSNESKSNKKRPKSGKKTQVVINLTSEKKSDVTNDILKSAMFVQNYESTTTSNANLSTKIEHITQQISINALRKTPSVISRTSMRSNEDSIGLKPNLDKIDTQMAETVLSTERTEPPPPPPPVTNLNHEQILISKNNLNETKQDQNDHLLPSRAELLDTRKRIKKGAFDGGDSMNDLVAFELGMMGSRRSAMKKTRFATENQTLNEDGTPIIPDNQATLDLLQKIGQMSSGSAVGQPPVSQKGCRFELPYDLKLLESLTPLDYLSKYCRLSSRRNYQFKRVFDRYRNSQYRLESNNLYSSIVDIHSEVFTRSQYNDLCQLIDIENQQYQFTYETFAGIVALCERILYDSSKFRSGLGDFDLAKDTIEKCDFDSLDRKLDGLIISDKLRRLLITI